VAVRWEALFDDLEAQLEAAEAAEQAGEVADRVRIESGRVRTLDRLAAARGHALAVGVHGAGPQRGTLVDAGVDWLLLDEGAGRELLVPVAAVLGITGLGTGTGVPGSEGAVGRRLDLRWALRGLARERVGVAVTVLDGTVVTGTVDRVGADDLELAEHGAGEPRRAAAVRGVRLIPIPALALVRRC